MVSEVVGPGKNFCFLERAVEKDPFYGRAFSRKMYRAKVRGVSQSFLRLGSSPTMLSQFSCSLTHSWHVSLAHYEGDQDLHTSRLAFSVEQGGTYAATGYYC
jgi:hypothetical protein